MRKLINCLCVLLFLLITHNIIQAQDFTVEIPTTDAFGHYLPPIKAGGSHQFQIEVTNNTSDTTTVSIDKNSLGADISSWVSIDNNSLKLFPSQSKNFLLTIKVPAGTCDCDFIMDLYFDAKDKDGDEHQFNYSSQIIIVDNSPPLAPTFSVSQTSTTIFITSWYSWDERSNIYTTRNQSAGIGGIKTYKLEIINPNGTIKKTVTKKVTDDNYYTFKDLNSNTNYKARVTAYDLVGNAKASEKSATTAPPKPAGLVFSNITYIDATLFWLHSAGATGYNVYRVSGSANTKLNSSPITSNSYKIEGLGPNTAYNFNVIALSNVGPSDRSDNAQVTTLPLPEITGSSTVCSGSYTYTIQDLLSGYTVSWSSSSHLNKQSSSGSSATFVKISDGSGWIGANIIAPNARVLELEKKYVWLGVPETPTSLIHPVFGCTVGEINVNLVSGASTYKWIISGGEIVVPVSGTNTYTGPSGTIFVDPIDGPHGFIVYVRGENACGVSSYYTKQIDTDCSGGITPLSLETGLMISPNPASDIIKVELIDNESIDVFGNNDKQKINVRLFNKMQTLVYSNITYQNKFDINVSNLPNGIYQLQVIYNGKKYGKQILIQH